MSEEEEAMATTTPPTNGASTGGFDLEGARVALQSSTVATRIAWLKMVDEQISHDSLDQPATAAVLRLLLWTHDAYRDRSSRRAVQQCLESLCKAAIHSGNVDKLAPLVAAIRRECAKPGAAITSVFVLVEWCSLLMQSLVGTPGIWAKLGDDIVLAAADGLEKCRQPAARQSVGQSAMVITRRGFRKLATCESREASVKRAVEVLTASGPQPTAKHAVLLGLIAGVCARKSEARPILGALKSEYFTFYTREMVGSRTPLPEHVTRGLDDFFAAFVSLDDLEKDVFPSLEKGLLRAPEVVLDLVTPLARALPDEIDLSATLASRFLKPLLSNVKSSSAAIRSGAVTAFETMLACRCRDTALLEDQVVDEILGPLKTNKLALADHRVLHADMLAALPRTVGIASKIANDLPAMTAKEGNETALAAETLALNASAGALLSAEGGGAQVPKALTDAYVKGLAEKKLPVRRIWILRAGELLYGMLNSHSTSALPPNLIQFSESILPQMLATFNEVVANPLAASQNGLITGALVLCALHAVLQRPEAPASLGGLIKTASVQQTSLMLEPKPSFLLNQRIYARFTDDDLRWLYRALSAVQSGLPSSEEPVRTAWAQAFIFLACSSNTPHKIREEAAAALSDLYVQSRATAKDGPGAVSEALILGIWHWIDALEAGDRESAAALAKSGTENLNLVLRCMCLPPKDCEKRVVALGVSGGLDPVQLETQMCSLLVLARPELVPRARWIDLCLKVELDPGELARKYEKRLVGEIVERSSYHQKSHAVKTAAYGAAADLVFVAPETMTSRIISLIQLNLAAAEIQSIGPLEAAIFRTREGTAFVDVLAKKQDMVPNKNTRDYSVLKWEDDLRAQLAKKKGTQKKLTADETAKVNAQLKKEAAIRDSVRHIEARLLRGFGVVRSLATGPPTDTALWMGPAVRAMLDVIGAGACLITGEVGPLSYISLSDRISSRLGPLRPFVGVAALQAQSHSNTGAAAASLPEGMTQEPVADLITRVLYRLRFVGEQRPFDTVSLIYILPPILMVIKNGGFGTAGGKTPSNTGESPNDEKDTQLVLAIELLAFHTDGCAAETIPRAEVLETLIFAMQQFKQHYKIIRDCFADMVRCVAPINMTADEMSVLAHGAIVPEESVRTAVLQAISSEVGMGETRGTVCEELIWLACHDHIDQNADLGHEIWDESEFVVTEDMPHRLLPYLESKDAQLRVAAARALAEACRLHPSAIESVLAQLRELYPELAKPRVPELDQFGMPKKMDLSDPWQARHGIAAAFEELAAHLQRGQLDLFFTFLIEKGPLGDQNANVRAKMLDAANAAIEVHGKAILDSLMKTFERTLEAPDSGSQAGDRVNEAVIIMYGALARHLKPGDAKIPVVIERLLATLSTPSETVQYAIAECLPPLVRSCGDKSSKYFDQIMETLLTSKKYAVQRGAAYGLAGLVHGRGITVLREYRILTSLRSALENKKESNQREAALLALELLATVLGRLFEPYAVQIVPQLLQGFGDSNGDVREAALAAAKACFARLSSYGVKQILPTLLNGLDEDQWRSKKGACDLLGAMAYLDPQQLAQSLPEIIPPLTAVLTDSHKEVRLAANKSLKRFGEVITNPEIHGLVDILLKALSDPTKYTDDALDSLIGVHFVHYLDPPSLALVTRILQRGLGDRSNTKRKSAQVIGSLAHLTERKDLISHLPVLVAGLKGAIVDPVPTTRATASRALGSLVEKLGEDAMPDLIPGLMHTLRTETGAGDRLGSAQALSEVLAGLGTSRLEETFPTILQNVESAKPSVREGFMTLFIFLPVCFGNSFANYLARIIPPILSGLADEVESIRDTALRAGRLLVKNFAVRAVDLLLPELERGLADDSYRIRLSSVELVGDLLFNLTGVKSSDAEDDESEEEQKETAREAGASLREVLGEEKRNNVLSALYICRCDTSGMVRAAAIAVWKALVPSPRILKELVPTLTQLIIRRLGSTNMEHKVIASNALGEMIRKAGDGVLSTLLPTLEEGLQSSSDTDAKQGICLALKELISSASDEALEEHEKTLISVVRTALTDANSEVREAAAEAFDSLQQILGKRAVDQVLPFLLNMLRSSASSDESAAVGGEANNALAALLTLLTETTRSNMILPNLIPTLIAPPISTFDARALASLCQVAGAAMNRRLPSIINSLMDNMVNSKSSEAEREALAGSFDIVITSIDDSEGLNQAMNVLLQLTKHEDHRKRAATARALARFFAAADKSSLVDYSRYHQDIVRALLISFDDYDAEVVQAAWTALSEFTKRLHKEDLELLVASTRQTLQQVGVAGHNLKGFELPKGISAVLPIFLQGLMNGTPEQRVAAALGLADVVDRTSEAALRPFVTQMTGPLIRVVSERSADVRAAVLLTLNRLLDKLPAALRPFLPQLQRTFAKALADPSSELLRQRAARALGTLIRHAPRVDPLLAELVAGVRAAADQGVRTAMLRALYEVVSTAGKGMGDAARQAVLGLIADHGLAGGGGGAAEDGPNGAADGARSSGEMAVNYARLFGALVANVPPDVATSLLKSKVMVTPATPASVLAMNAVLKESPAVLLESPLADDVPEVLRVGIGSRNLFVADNSILAAGKYILSRHGEPKAYDITKPLYQTLAGLIQPASPLGGGGSGISPDTRRLALVAVRLAARLRTDAARAHLAALAPAVFAAVRDPNIPVKLAAESAFVELFAVADEEARVFDKWMGPGGDGAELVAAAGNASLKRTMTDYFRRVAMRIGGGLRERREREGLGIGSHGSGAEEAEALLRVVLLPAEDGKDGKGELLLAPEEVDDLREVMAVGRADDGKDVFGTE